MAPEPSSKSSSAPRSASVWFGHFTVVRLALASLMAGLLTSCPAQADPEPTLPDTAIVEFVIDGDTVDVVIAGESERVRLIGIDTPESVSRDVPVQCYGSEASAALTGLLPPGTMLRVERDEEARDRFGRLLLYLYRSDDGLFVNQWMIEQGFADTLFFEPNTTFEGPFTRARNEARAASLGLWGACDGPDQPLE